MINNSTAINPPTISLTISSSPLVGLQTHMYLVKLGCHICQNRNQFVTYTFYSGIGFEMVQGPLSINGHGTITAEVQAILADCSGLCLPLLTRFLIRIRILCISKFPATIACACSCLKGFTLVCGFFLTEYILLFCLAMFWLVGISSSGGLVYTLWSSSALLSLQEKPLELCARLSGHVAFHLPYGWHGPKATRHNTKGCYCVLRHILLPLVRSLHLACLSNTPCYHGHKFLSR